MRPPLSLLDDTETTGGRRKPPRPSTVGIRQSSALRKARRRSSARFLQLKSSSRDDVDSSSSATSSSNGGNLQELYKKAIRMNAENKINASNSWSLRLIENIDNFLEEETEKDIRAEQEEEQVAEESTTNQPQDNRRVNFTKASCTLDASVKIYSYRVDDVHLTSYKVLANLHRNSHKDTSNKDSADGDATTSAAAAAREKARAPVNTLERNMANLNMNKLDSAFDIDPLFSKMSKAFDEGGAKGLLLANLGVGEKGCNIVFDSTADCDEDEDKSPDSTEGASESNIPMESLMDIGFLTTKLQEATEEASVDTLPLVPQLSSLRAEHAQLEEEGFVVDDQPEPSSRRRALHFVSEEEEREADRSIHQEALERSRASLGRSFVADDDDDDDDRPLHTYDDGDDDDDGGLGGNLFSSGDDDDDYPPFSPRFSASSFTAESQSQQQETQRTAALLDLMADSQALWTQQDDRVYWKAPNQWAGVAHWKKNRPVKAGAPKTATEALSSSKNKTPKKTPARKKAAISVDLSTDTSRLADLLKKKSKKAATGWSQTTINKHGKNENVLPLDAGIGVEQLHSLFLRPMLVQKATDGSEGPPKKTVGFAAPDYYGDDDDDGGPGFFMGSNDDGMDEGDDDEEFVVPELEGIRKVSTVHVGYATVAKKVDVKRLKADLWDELEQRLSLVREKNEEADEEDTNEEDDDDMSDASAPNVDDSEPLSFQKAVQDMEMAKSQPDVTLPFYFICMLHLANEKGLRLDSHGLEDFTIHAK